jgi:hypothetical protein
MPPPTAAGPTPAAGGPAASKCVALLRASTIPIQVTLCPADVTAQQPPLPCFFNVPRRSVLAALWAPLSESFSDSIADFGTPPPMWLMLEADEARLAAGEKSVQPIPWQVPVGAIADTLGSRSRAPAPARNDMSFIGLELPLRLVAHMSPPPPKTTAWRIQRAKECDILAQQCLKQGLMARFGGLRAFYKAAPEHIAAFAAGSLAHRVGAAAEHEAFRAATEAILRVGRTVCVHDGDTPRLPVTVHRAGRRFTTTIDTPITKAAKAAIDAAAKQEREQQARREAEAAAAKEAATATAAASFDKEGQASHDQQPQSQTQKAGPEGASSPAGSQPASPAAPAQGTPPRTNSTASAAEPETPHNMRHGSPLQVVTPRANAPEDSSNAHSDSLLLARAIAAALTPEELSEAGCNLRDVDAPPAEPFLHPRLLVLVGGLRPLLTTPLAWAMEHLVYADLALHVVVIDSGV